MRAPVVIPPNGGEVISDSPERRVEILCEHDAVHATWSRFGPGRDGAGLHVHRRHHDIFYVIEGELTVKLGLDGDEATLAAGTLACVPPFVVHGFRNASADEVRYLNFHALGVGFADYMRGLRDGRKVVYDQEDPPSDGGRALSDAIVGATQLDIEPLKIDGTAPGGPSPRLECFYVLEGELVVNDTSAPAGAWVEIPPGVPYAAETRGRIVRISAG